MDNEFAKVAFLDGDGHIQWCGIDAEIYSEPEFVYLGNGTVTFKLKSEDGSPYEVQVAFSADGSKVSFTVKKNWEINRRQLGDREKTGRLLWQNLRKNYGMILMKHWNGYNMKS